MSTQTQGEKTIAYRVRDAALNEQLNSLASALRTSRSGIGIMALEFLVPRLESGEAQIVNGKVVLANRERTKEAA